jgi:nucleotide-binding universal stress UspA family protein
MTVVVGFIPDKFGDAALAAGIEEARRRSTRMVVVNATRGDALIDRRYLGAEGLADLEERLAGVDVEHEVRQAMGTDVAEEMIRVVREVDGQVLVIGMRHRTPVGKMIMGSVAQQVLLDAPCPVLAVKPAPAAKPS